MNVLLLGSGGREHAFAWKISQSPKLSKLYISPGNGGTAVCGENVALDNSDFEALYRFCIQKDITLLLPGNEEPLVNGIKDFFQEKNEASNKHILVAGPSLWAAQLEGSKDFSKRFMLRHAIPTAGYATFKADTIQPAKAFLRTLNAPYVLKADGLAAGKGVIITDSLDEAEASLDQMFSGKFGEAGNTVVIEEFLHGIEISVFAVSDGNSWKLLGSAKDYKRIGEGDTGLNTGGMGAISPVPFADDAFIQKVIDRIIEPTFEGMKKEGHPFAGFLFVGLMNCAGEPMVIEYNVRMGDPETESIVPRLKTDMLDIALAIAGGNLDGIPFELDPRTAATVFLVSEGYPGHIQKEDPYNCLL